MLRCSLSLALSALLVALPAVSHAGASPGPGASELAPGPARTPGPVVPISPDPEIFREQMLRFIGDMDAVLTQALRHPTIGEKLAALVAQSDLQVPFPPDTYEALREASPEVLLQVRDAVAPIPSFLQAPAVLASGLEQIPPPEMRPSAVSGTTCTASSDVYQEFNTIVSKTNTVNSLTTGSNAVGLVKSVLSTISGTVNAAVSTCETPIDIPTSWAQIFIVVLVGITDLTQLALDLAKDEIAFQIVESDRCINHCVGHGFVERHRIEANEGTSDELQGKGCDNRDNDCVGGIDEVSEDMVLPTISIGPSVASGCYPDTSSAETAIDLALRAGDDCYPVTVNRSPLVVANCQGMFTATATESLAGKMATLADPPVLRVDGDPPVIGLPALAACYPTLDDARTAVAGATVTDCGTTSPFLMSPVETTIEAVEKECLADFSLEAIDECGNRSTAMATVRVDDTPPLVDIETLLLPDVDGLACFDTVNDAIATVAEATRISDNCTPHDALDIRASFLDGGRPSLETAARGRTPLDLNGSGGDRGGVGLLGTDACDIEVTTSARDQCNLESSDMVVVRVDTTPPVVTCNLATDLLWPADDSMVDVGFSMNLMDNCDGADTSFELFVTSDEPTSFNLRIAGEDDIGPDAEVDFAPDGSVSAIRLRAQRKQTAADDGRVYRIRVVATDSCGLSSQTDCFVTVPKNFSNGQGTGAVVNSGQFYDATIIN